MVTQTQIIYFYSTISAANNSDKTLARSLRQKML